MQISLRARGIFQILCSGLCFAFLGTFAKIAGQRQIDILSLLGVRFLFAGVLLFLICFFMGKVHLQRSQFLKSVLMGVLGYASFSFFYFKSLGGMAAGTAVVILFLYPVFVYLFELIQARQWPALKMIAVLIVSLGGVFLLVNGELNIERPQAFLYGFLASLLYGTYVFLSAKYAKGLEPYFSTSLIQISAGLCLCFLAPLGPVNLFHLFLDHWDLFLGLSFISSILPMTLFLLAAQKITSFELSVLNVTEPLFGIIFSAVLLGETLTALQLLGAVLVLAVSVEVSRAKPTF